MNTCAISKFFLMMAFHVEISVHRVDSTVDKNTLKRPCVSLEIHCIHMHHDTVYRGNTILDL